MIRTASLALLLTTLAACESNPATPQVEAADPPPVASSANPSPAPLAIDEPLETGSQAADYSVMAHWLCHAETAGSDACAVDLSTTVVDVVEGEVVVTIEAHTPANAPEIDCFYVYPTVSTDPAGNSDLEPGAQEFRAVAGQFARFSSVCRQFAPMYRQLTLAALNARLTGQPMETDDDLPLEDVTAAWTHYLENYNEGRGVILIGHSQGSIVLQQLLSDVILGSDQEDLIVSAMPTGITYPRDEANTFLGMPACETASQTGCIMAYSTFRADYPPSPFSIFGINSAAGEAMCVNPAEVSGDEGMLDPYLRNGPDILGNMPSFAEGLEVTTPYVRLPGLLSVECASANNHNFLALTVNADVEDARTDVIAGDFFTPDGNIDQIWGLHLLDIHAPMGNLLTIAQAQSAAWSSAHAD